MSLRPRWPIISAQRSVPVGSTPTLVVTRPVAAATSTHEGPVLSQTDPPPQTELQDDRPDPATGPLSARMVPARDPGERALVDALLRSAGRGDVSSFEQLYQRTSARIFGLANAVLRNTTAAEDVTQDAFLDIWRRSAQFDSRKSPALPWMLMITHGRAVDHIRRSERMRANDAQAPRLTDAGPAYDEVVEQVLRGEPDAALHAALTGLTGLQREALHLVYWQGFSGIEASEILDIPLPTFKSRVRGALNALRSASSGAAEGVSDGS